MPAAPRGSRRGRRRTGEATAAPAVSLRPRHALLGAAGALVTGIDFSTESIASARRLAADTAIQAEFVCSDLYELPESLLSFHSFDVVFTSYGVLCWLPNLAHWAELIARYLKPGGFFYIVEAHPSARMFPLDEDLPHSGGFRPGCGIFTTPRDSSGRLAPTTRRYTIGSTRWATSSTRLIGAGLGDRVAARVPLLCLEGRRGMRGRGTIRRRPGLLPATAVRTAAAADVFYSGTGKLISIALTVRNLRMTKGDHKDVSGVAPPCGRPYPSNGHLRGGSAWTDVEGNSWRFWAGNDRGIGLGGGVARACQRATPDATSAPHRRSGSGGRGGSVQKRANNVPLDAVDHSTNVCSTAHPIPFF